MEQTPPVQACTTEEVGKKFLLSLLSLLDIKCFFGISEWFSGLVLHYFRPSQGYVGCCCCGLYVQQCVANVTWATFLRCCCCSCLCCCCRRRCCCCCCCCCHRRTRHECHDQQQLENIFLLQSKSWPLFLLLLSFCSFVVVVVVVFVVLFFCLFINFVLPSIDNFVLSSQLSLAMSQVNFYSPRRRSKIQKVPR